MNICLVGAILRHTIVTDAGEYSGWGGMTESAVAPFAPLLREGSTIHFVGNVGREDIEEVRAFFRERYPFVDTSGIGINPTGTDHHYGTKNYVKVKLRVEPTRYEQIEPHIGDADVVIFNYGNIDDIDPAAIRKAKEHSKAIVHVDVHRKPFGADADGYIYRRGWPGWEEHLGHADVVQMNTNECEALFQKKMENTDDLIAAATKVLDAGAQQVLITRSSNGVLLALRSPSYQYLLAPAAPCAVVDTTGAGDAFAAGYLVALHEGKSPIEAAKWGSVMGAINCEFTGYMRNVSRQMVENRIPKDFEPIRVNPRSV